MEGEAVPRTHQRQCHRPVLLPQSLQYIKFGSQRIESKANACLFRGLHGPQKTLKRTLQPHIITCLLCRCQLLPEGSRFASYIGFVSHFGWLDHFPDCWMPRVGPGRGSTEREQSRVAALDTARDCGIMELRGSAVCEFNFSWSQILSGRGPGFMGGYQAP